MSGYDQSSIAVPMPTVTGSAAALGGPYKIKPSEAFSGALMTVSGLTGETISVQTSPDGYQGAPANPSFYRTDWQGTSLLYSTARTNYIVYSQQVDQAASWVPTATGLGSVPVVTANYTTAPDGTLTADRVVFNHGVSSVIGDASNIVAGAVVQSGSVSWCHSVWMKTNDGTTRSFHMSIAGAGAIVAVVTPIWQRFNCVYNGNGTFNLRIFYRGDLDSNPTADVAIWGAQGEQASAPTSYILTTTGAVTVTDYTLSNGVITMAQAPITGATLSYDNSVLPSPYYIFATGDGTQTAFAYDGVWGTLSANSAKGNGIWQIDLRGAQAYQLVKSAGSETATVNMTLKRDALQYKNTAGTWSVT